MKKASVYTLGCRLNQTESALVMDHLERENFTFVPWGEPADVMIINSCSVTGTADQKTRQIVRQAKHRNPSAYMIIMGCGVSKKEDCSQWQKSDLVDLILPNTEKSKIIEYLPAKFRSSVSEKPSGVCSEDRLFKEEGVGRYYEKTRANLKIQEGCNFFCSYCIVPYLRGEPRSREWQDVLREMQALLAQGYQEIVLTGVNVATYNDHGRNLADLVRELLKFPGDFRLRLSSTEPGPVVYQLAEIMAEDSRLCRFLHLSVQYAENTILKAMNRRYTIEDYQQLLAFLTTKIPDICIGSDLIVGFPGETDDLFEQCCQNVKKLPLAYIHVFSYSPREGTKAATMPNQVPATVAKKRHEEFAALVHQKSHDFSQRFIGKTVQILTEHCDEEGKVQGWTDNYLRVVATTTAPVQSNQWLRVLLTALKDDRALQGVQVE